MWKMGAVQISSFIIIIIILVSPRAHLYVVGMLWFVKDIKLAHSFLFSSGAHFSLYVPFNCISFHKFSRELSAFSLCSSGFNSAALVLSTILSLYESLPQPWYNPLWLAGLKASTNYTLACGSDMAAALRVFLEEYRLWRFDWMNLKGGMKLH